ncbi:MAG: iron-containing alcohol dehydrogenase, partial [Desulfobacterales bacterium]|nr:iron-containing alcohol dehydrogenase [Desulfobacterales bacterium]
MTVNGFICPTKTAFGRKALEHLPFELFCADAHRPLVLACQDQLDQGIHRPLVNAFRDSQIPLCMAGVDLADPDTLKQLHTGVREKGCDALLVLGEGPLVNLAKQLELALSQGPEILRQDMGQLPPDSRELKAVPLILLPTRPETAWDFSGRVSRGTIQWSSPHLAPDLVCISPELTRPPDDLSPILDAGFTALAVCTEVLTLADQSLALPYAAMGLEWTLAHFPALVAAHLGEDSTPPKKEIKNKKEWAAGLIHATAVAGYLLTNFPDLACFKALASSDLPESSPPLVPGQAMALSLVK